jgi:hypothetical protein
MGIYWNGLSGFGITAQARFSPPHRETAKAANLDPVTRTQGFREGVQEARER